MTLSIAARSVSWHNPATERKWRRLFATLVLPGIGAKPIDEVTLGDLREITLPHWYGRGSTGYVLHQHFDSVMRWSVAHGHRPDNPAEQLKVLVPKVKAVVHHHPSLPHRKVCVCLRPRPTFTPTKPRPSSSHISTHKVFLRGVCHTDSCFPPPFEINQLRRPSGPGQVRCVRLLPDRASMNCLCRETVGFARSAQLLVLYQTDRLKLRGDVR